MKITTVTSSCSRAIVHSDWIVYIAEPSPSSANTGRSGQAIAAPIATGSPWPMAPPVTVRTSWRGAPAVWAASVTPEVSASSETIAPSGRSAPTAWHTPSAVSGPARERRAGGRLARRVRRPPAPSASASASRLASASWSGAASSCTSQRSGTR